ncbi:MAG: M28 family peptidase [Blastocatellia bacterium]
MEIGSLEKTRIALAMALLLTTCAVVLGQSRLKAQTGPTSKYFDTGQLLRDVEYLASDELEGRSADRPSIELSRSYLDRSFEESKLKTIGKSFRQEFVIRYRTLAMTPPGVNFIGLIKGKKYREKYIVISAHYDHLGIENGLTYNGASDNASGTAALFAIASYFQRHRPDHSLLFVAFDAEEQTYQGSLHFMANLPIKKESILLNVNLDMISQNDKGELYAAGLSHYPQLRPAMEAAQKRAKVKLLFGHDRRELGDDDWTPQSDHFIFYREKIPWIYFGVEDHKDYHRPTDDFANIQSEFYVRAVETIIEAIRGFDGLIS